MNSYQEQTQKLEKAVNFLSENVAFFAAPFINIENFNNWVSKLSKEDQDTLRIITNILKEIIENGEYPTQETSWNGRRNYTEFSYAIAGIPVENASDCLLRGSDEKIKHFLSSSNSRIEKVLSLSDNEKFLTLINKGKEIKIHQQEINLRKKQVFIEKEYSILNKRQIQRLEKNLSFTFSLTGISREEFFSALGRKRNKNFNLERIQQLHLYLKNYYKKLNGPKLDLDEVLTFSEEMASTLARYYWKIDHGHFSIEEVKDLLNKQIKFETKSLRKQAYTYLYNKQYEAALEIFNQYLEKDPQDFTALRGLANVYNELSEFKTALEYANKSIEMHPSSIAFKIRGNIFLKQGLYEKALADFNRSIEINPKNEFALLKQIIIYHDLKQSQKLLETFDLLIKIDPNNIKIFNEFFQTRGQRHALEGQYGKALEDFNKVIELNPKDSKTLKMRADVYFLLDQDQEALRDLNQIINENPDELESLQLRVDIFIRKGLYQEALKAYPNDLVRFNSVMNIEQNFDGTCKRWTIFSNGPFDLLKNDFFCYFSPNRQNNLEPSFCQSAVFMMASILSDTDFLLKKSEKEELPMGIKEMIKQCCQFNGDMDDLFKKLQTVMNKAEERGKKDVPITLLGWKLGKVEKPKIFSIKRSPWLKDFYQVIQMLNKDDPTTLKNLEDFYKNFIEEQSKKERITFEVTMGLK